MKLIVGLGNVGKEYEGTRHNAGFLAVRWLAEDRGLENQWSHIKKLEAWVTRDQQRNVILAQPTTMMNESGRAVRKLMDYYKLKTVDTTVIHDDADLEIGHIRSVDSTQTGAGHHGILSVVQHIGPGFKRIRIGIGRPDQPVRDIAGWVLKRIGTDEAAQLFAAFKERLEKLL